MYLRSLLFALTVLSVVPSPCPAAAPFPARPEPFQGAVVGGRTLLTTDREPEMLVFVCITPLAADVPRHRTLCSWADIDWPLRWHVADDAIYVMDASPSRRFASIETLQRFDLFEMLKGRAITFPGTREWDNSIRPFTSQSPAQIVRMVGSSVDFDDELYYDYLPAGPFRVRQFVLTNVRGTLKPRGKADLVAGYAIQFAGDERSTPHWSFTVHFFEGTWDKRKGAWSRGPWKTEETLAVAFEEHFRALARGDDYFFLTNSGRLFVSPRPAKPLKSGPRPVLPVWTDGTRPILGFITDVDRQRHFLFVPPERKGGKPAWFELSDKPRLVEYDPVVAAAPKAAEPYRSILHHARILTALKVIPTR